MFPTPNALAIQLYNVLTPSEWQKSIPRSLRADWLTDKARVMAQLEPSIKVALVRILNEYPALLSLDLPNRPAPRLPAFMSEIRGVDPIRILSNSQTHRILNHIQSGNRFGTDWVDGDWRIVAPKINGTLQDLAGLAHELGHVLINGNNPQQSFREMIRSEGMAMALEETVVASQLTSVECSAWHSYQRQVDAFNFQFFAAEMKTAISEVDGLLNSAYVYRESLWTSHGYQGVYAAASIIRAAALGVKYECAC